ncbi:MAG: sigma-70 family RNA polymerase sigma factor [Actinomycetota bacterium]
MVIEDQTFQAGAAGGTDEPALTGVAFEDLFHAERTRLFQALCLLTGDRYEAEDLAQEAFVRVYERWERVGGLEDPIGYLYRTAMNAYRSSYRRAKTALRRHAIQVERDDALVQVEQRARVLELLAHLTDKQRAALVLVDLVGFTSEEAARILRSSPGAVRTQASRARSALRTMTEDEDA